MAQCQADRRKVIYARVCKVDTASIQTSLKDGRGCMCVPWQFGLDAVVPGKLGTVIDMSRGKESCLDAQLSLTRWRRCALRARIAGVCLDSTSEMMSGGSCIHSNRRTSLRASAMWGSAAEISAKSALAWLALLRTRYGLHHLFPMFGLDGSPKSKCVLFVDCVHFVNLVAFV